MKRIIYQSDAVTPMSEGAIADLLVKARSNNARDNITGMLVYLDPDGPEEPGVFLQALEGPEESVDACFARIKEDFRHTDIKVIADDVIYSRAFDGWTLGHRAVNPGDLQRLLSLSQLTAQSLREMSDADKAMDLLGAPA